MREDVAGGYAAARSAAALIALPERAVMAVVGPFRQKFLHQILSNDVQSRQPGEGCRAALMDVKGRLLSFMRVLVRSDSISLEVPADRADVVEKTFVHFRVAAPVRFLRGETRVLALIGEESRALLGRVGATVPELPLESHVAVRIGSADVLVARAGDFPADGYVLQVAAMDADGLVAALHGAGAAPLERNELDALRIEDGRPWYGPDIAEENLLHETGLLREYHSFSKGCYIGQEIVARLEGRGGNVNKQIRALRLSAPVAVGTTLVDSDDKEVGRVTTAAVSPTFGAIAMGYVHRTRFEPGTALRAGEATAVVSALPLRAEGA